MMKKDERGFSYLDVMFAVTILLFGVMALAAAVTAAVVRTRDVEQQQKAKQYANSTLESIFSARDLDNLGWDAVNNISTCTGGTAAGMFVCTTQPLYPEPGADEVVGTADDTGTPVPGFERQITITDIDDPDRPVSTGNPIMFRRIDVTITYHVTGFSHQETASTIMTRYADIQ